MASEMDDINNSEAKIPWMQIQVSGLMREFQEENSNSDKQRYQEARKMGLLTIPAPSKGDNVESSQHTVLVIPSSECLVVQASSKYCAHTCDESIHMYSEENRKLELHTLVM